MSQRVHEIHEGRVAPGGIAAEDFGRQVRELARDAHRLLGDPGVPIDELLALHGRVFHLLQEVPGTRMGRIRRWLLAVGREVAARLEAWAAEELQSLVA